MVLRLRINHWRQGGALRTVRVCKARATCRRAPDCSETCEELYIEGYDWWKTVRLRIWETSATRAAIVRKKMSLQPEAVEQMQLRGRRRIDGVGRPEFDFHTHTGLHRTFPY